MNCKVKVVKSVADIIRQLPPATRKVVRQRLLVDLPADNAAGAGRPCNRAKSGTPSCAFRLTPAERAALDEHAQARGADTSTWARAELLALAGRPIGGPGGS